jgi:hypothetical protein
MARGTEVITFDPEPFSVKLKVPACAGNTAIVPVIKTATIANTIHAPRVIIIPPEWIFK